MINHFFNKSIVIRRLSDIGGNVRNYVSTGTYDAHIQQISEIPTDAGEFAVGQITHKAWTDITNDIKIGDRIEDSDGMIYEVMGTKLEGLDTAVNEYMAVFIRICIDQIQ